MSHLTKLFLAVLLALGAAALNAMWLSAEKRPPTFVAANADVATGTVITDAMLRPVPVPGDLAQLTETLIPYGTRATLLGRKAPRSYLRGDVFFQTDIQAPNELAQFELLGPFRLISVGQRFTQAASKQDESQLDASGNTITIAVSADFDERTRRLLQIIDPLKNPGRGSAGRIIAIQVIPKEDQKEPLAKEDKNVVYQTIRLDGIANVPRVLLAGDVIRFVIPTDSL